jgi:hypothetical protein
MNEWVVEFINPILSGDGIEWTDQIIALSVHFLLNFIIFGGHRTKQPHIQIQIEL